MVFADGSYRVCGYDNSVFYNLTMRGNLRLQKSEEKLIERFLRENCYDKQKVQTRAKLLVHKARQAKTSLFDVAKFFQEYRLDQSEGTILLSLAEALLRIPDSITIDSFIKDRISSGNWENDSRDFAIKLSSQALTMANKVLKNESFFHRLGEPVIRLALCKVMKMMAGQFIIGQSIEEAIKNINSKYLYSFDMLGESAKTKTDAAKYLQSYRNAIMKLNSNQISIKLSALHPRFEPLQENICVPELIEIVTSLCSLAKKHNVSITIDAEEANKLEITLDIFEAVLRNPIFAGWDGLGLAVQAYQRRATALIDWISVLGDQTNHRIPVRLVKGAYWDTEIKYAQVNGYEDYPVFTRKAATDISWIVCAKKMFSYDNIIPAFATHNAHSLAFILETANKPFEMQRLFGMGEALYSSVDCPVRIYAPVGNHRDLLSYLVRRMLENGANSSFVHRLTDPNVSEDMVVSDPIDNLKPSKIPLPPDIYPDRQNSIGIDLSNRPIVFALLQNMKETSVDLKCLGVDESIDILEEHWRTWDAFGGDKRAIILEKAADLFEYHKPELLYYLCKEAGKTIPDGLAEIRETVDFCRWYAMLARKHFSSDTILIGPTGETNTWSLKGKGIFVCISPWNFPLSILVGQITAALAAGNAVIAKPAEQTPLIAAKAIEILHKAGIPQNILKVVFGDGKIGNECVINSKISGVAFTGSNEVAKKIAYELVQKLVIIPFIAETGGINAMIADSTALPEQLVSDILVSAFGSSGQRCSSLRLLCLQKDNAIRVLSLLCDAAETLVVGDPFDLSTDIGPIIDLEAKTRLDDYVKSMGEPYFELALPDLKGCYFAPRIYVLDDIDGLSQEVFGPVLHIVLYDDLDEVLSKISKKGYGLTLGIHSRNETTQKYICEKLRIGNIYINRNQIGATVGVQPFGGNGLSGTGPKVGGPFSLHRYADEFVVSVNTTASGGNVALLSV